MDMTTEEIKALQRELGVTPDGIIGPITRAAAEAKLAADAELFGESDPSVVNPQLASIANTEGIVRGNDTVDVTTEDTGPQEGDTKTEGGINYVWKNGNWEVVPADSSAEFTPFYLYNEDGVAILVNSADQEAIYRGQGFTLTSPPSGEGGGVDTDTLSDILGTYAQQQQVQEVAQTGASTYEQAKGLFPYLDDRLIRLYLDKYAESGNERLALAEMRADPVMAEVYPGIKRTDGTLRMTEQEYVAAIDNMKASLRNYNLNPNEFEDDIVGAISGDVSPLEFRQRLDAGYEGVVNNIPQVKEAYLQNFGVDLPDESIFAMFVSPNVATKILEGNIRASQVIGEAESAGFGVNKLVAQSLVQQGLTQEGARKGFGQAQLSLRGIQGAAARQGRQNITATEYVEATQLGAAQELQRLQNVLQQVESESSAILGAVRTQQGAVTGLEEA
jgi:peptidoglycan hydrolase-like protein with peptidoglycan-binding domain